MVERAAVRWDEQPLPTARGPARVLIAGPGWPLVVLLHGASSGVRGGAFDVLAGTLLAGGLAVAGFEQPYRVAGRRAPDRAEFLDAVLLGALPEMARRAGAPVEGPLLAGRSSGARVACRVAAACGARGILALGFPYRPPRSQQDRGDELAAAGLVCPVLVVQGRRDPFGCPSASPGVTVRRVDGGHTPGPEAARLGAAWLVRLAGNPAPAAGVPA